MLGTAERRNRLRRHNLWLCLGCNLQLLLLRVGRGKLGGCLLQSEWIGRNG